MSADRIPTMTDRAETRDELAAAASASAARNTPRALPVLAAFVFLACAIYLGLQLGARGDAEDRLGSSTARATTIEGLISQIEEARASGDAGSGPGLGDPIPDLLSRLSSLAERNGVTLGSPRERNVRSADVTELRVTYDARDQQFEGLYAWIESALDTIPGLKVYSVRLSPGRVPRRAAQGSPTGWDATVTFVRLERSS
ncbi:MAG: hypothetical protein AAGG07_09510 [Planctomycetota bacterium]